MPSPTALRAPLSSGSTLPVVEVNSTACLIGRLVAGRAGPRGCGAKDPRQRGSEAEGNAWLCPRGEATGAGDGGADGVVFLQEVQRTGGIQEE